MRIIAGIWRGRVLVAPKGKGTRPTTDRVRESMMSSIASLRDGFENAQVLDAFAGSGALAFEALSRGGAAAVLCDADRGAVDVLRRNARTLRIDAKTAPSVLIRLCDSLSRPPHSTGAPYDLVLLDPPYATNPAKVFAMLDALAAAGSLSHDAIAVYEHSRSDEVRPFAEEAAVSWQHAQSKRYGETAIDYFRRIFA